jgi:hypothetical protein
MCYIPFDRSILPLSNVIRYVMPSTDRMLELTAKHRWLSRLTGGCVFQWVKKYYFKAGNCFKDFNKYLTFMGLTQNFGFCFRYWKGGQFWQ